MNNIRRKVKEWIETLELTRSEKKRIQWIGVISVLLAMLLQFMDNKPLGDSVLRNTYGNGDRVEELQICVEPAVEDKKRLEFQLEVQEQEYSEQELETVIENIETEIDRLVIGENEKPECIIQPLNLITEVAPYPMEIQWTWTPYESINSDGEIQQDSMEDGDILELCALISYGEEEVQYRKCVSLYKSKISETEKLLMNIQEEVEKEKLTKQEIELPQEVDGVNLEWKGKQSYRGIGVAVVGVLIMGLLLMKKQQDIQLLKNQNQAILIQDYPVIISNIVLYVGAGMTVKNAWKNIIQEAEKKEIAHRSVYPEMKRTWHELINGQSEIECYENFGKRCGTRGYQRMGLLLSQNLRRGTKGLLEQLEKESIEAFEERKNYARQKGEQASTKLLFPMSLMLMVVLVIVIVPAFLSIQL